MVRKENALELIKKSENHLNNPRNVIDPEAANDIRIVLALSRKLVEDALKNSRNSNKPPSTNNKFERKPKDKGDKKKKPGGQPGHEGKTLVRVDNPDKIVSIPVNREILPEGECRVVGYRSRQVFDVEMRTDVTEYRVEVVEVGGKTYVADFPDEVTKAAQYGPGVKSLIAYMSGFQLIPLDRMRDFFNDQFGLPISKGTISNAKGDLVRRLDDMDYENRMKFKLLNSKLLNADETGISLDGSLWWLHTLGSEKGVLFHPSPRRGAEAMWEMGVIPLFEGVLCHDGWPAYFVYVCYHALCNAHHIRELEFAWEHDNQKWAKKMIDLLEEVGKLVKESDYGRLSDEECKRIVRRYRVILLEGGKECPAVEENGKRGRTQQTKSRNLLDRLSKYEEETLRFMRLSHVPFSNNLAEQFVRVFKMYMNVSKCFRTSAGAREFCLIRSCIITGRMNGMSAAKVTNCIFRNEIPFFLKE